MLQNTIDIQWKHKAVEMLVMWNPNKQKNYSTKTQIINRGFNREFFLVIKFFCGSFSFFFIKCGRTRGYIAVKPVIPEQPRNVQSRRWATRSHQLLIFHRWNTETEMRLRRQEMCDVQSPKLPWFWFRQFWMWNRQASVKLQSLDQKCMNLLSVRRKIHEVIERIGRNLKESTQAHISNTTTMFCFSFHRNDEPTESSGNRGFFKQADIAKLSLKY